MIRTCPKCGDYYADALLAFCLGDGTPLVNVAPTGEKWNEAARAIQAKEHTLSKQKRKQKWQRIVVSTMVLTTLVTLSVAVNALIYVESVPNRHIAPRPSIPETAPAVVSNSIPASTPAETSPAPSQNPTPTPTRVSVEKETPTPTPTPIVITASGKPPECSIGNKSQEEKAITDKYGAKWQGSLAGDPPEIDAQELPFGIVITHPAVRIEKPKLIIEYQSTFPKPCAATVTASYSWQVTINFNGQRKVLNKNAVRRKFTCEKTGQAWHCP
jgi:hypothetical protein